MIWKRFIISVVIVSATARIVAHQYSDSKASQIVCVSASKRGFAGGLTTSSDLTVTKGSPRLIKGLCSFCHHTRLLPLQRNEGSGKQQETQEGSCCIYKAVEQGRMSSEDEELVKFICNRVTSRSQ